MGKQNPSFCWKQKTHLNIKDRHSLKVKVWKKIFQANGLKKKAGVAILISSKIDFKPKLKEMGKIHQDETSILDIYVPNTSTHFGNRNIAKA